jgi:hypothetical protein
VLGTGRSFKFPPARKYSRYAQSHADNFDQEHVRQEKKIRTTLILVTLLILTTVFSTSFTETEECKRLKDGKYKVQFKRFPKSNFTFQIDKNKFIRTDKSGNVTKGTIEWTSDCSFILSSDTTTADNNVTKQIKLGLGSPCYELTKTRGRVTSFVLTRSNNLNILIDEGKIKQLE